MSIKRDVIFLEKGTESDEAIIELMRNPRFFGGKDQLAYIDDLDGLVRDASIDSSQIFSQLANGLKYSDGSSIPIEVVRAWFAKDITTELSLRHEGEDIGHEDATPRIISESEREEFSENKFKGADVMIDTYRFVEKDGFLYDPRDSSIVVVKGDARKAALDKKWKGELILDSLFLIAYNGEELLPSEAKDRIVNIPKKDLDKKIAEIEKKGPSAGTIYIDSMFLLGYNGNEYFPSDVRDRIVNPAMDDIDDIVSSIERNGPAFGDVYLDSKMVIERNGKFYLPQRYEDRIDYTVLEDLINGDKLDGYEVMSTEGEFEIDDVESNEFRIAKLSKEKMIEWASLYGWEPRFKYEQTKYNAREFLRTIPNDGKLTILNEEFTRDAEVIGIARMNNKATFIPNTPATIIPNKPSRITDNTPAEVIRTPLMLVDWSFQATSLYTLDPNRRLRAILALLLTSKQTGLLQQEPTARSAGAGIFGEKNNEPVRGGDTVRTRVGDADIYTVLGRVRDMLDGGDYDNDGEQIPRSGSQYLDNFWTSFDGFALVTRERRNRDTGEMEYYDEVDFYFEYYPNYGED